MLEIKIIKNKSDLEKAMVIRRKVFVDEQNVPECIEIDEFETESTHILALQNGQPVGTARWRVTTTGIKLERYAVLPEYRGSHIGAALLKFTLNNIDTETTVYLFSQISAVGFYKKYGFANRGKIFYEANIPHRKMVFVK